MFHSDALRALAPVVSSSPPCFVVVWFVSRFCGGIGVIFAPQAGYTCTRTDTYIHHTHRKTHREIHRHMRAYIQIYTHTDLVDGEANGQGLPVRCENNRLDREEFGDWLVSLQARASACLGTYV